MRRRGSVRSGGGAWRWDRGIALVLVAALCVALFSSVALATAWHGGARKVVSTFIDEFSGLSMGRWAWLDPKASNTGKIVSSSGNSYLQMPVESGTGLLGPGHGGLQNVLLWRDGIEDGVPFIIETKVIFDPTKDFQDACLLVYRGNDYFLALGLAFATPPAGSGELGAGVGKGLYFDMEKDGKPPMPVPPRIVPQNFAHAYGQEHPVWLRIVRYYKDTLGGRRELYVAQYAIDEGDEGHRKHHDLHWITLGTHIYPLGQGWTGGLHAGDVSVGIAAWDSRTGNVGPVAQFDYFALAALKSTVHNAPGHPTTLE